MEKVNRTNKNKPGEELGKGREVKIAAPSSPMEKGKEKQARSRMLCKPAPC
jgi:hypothetical protein